MALRVLRASSTLKIAGGGGGDHGGDQANRFGNFLDAEGGILLDNATGLGVFVGVVNVLGGIVILDHLVLQHAHAGFLHCHAGKRDAGLVGRCSRSEKDRIHLLLGIGSKLLLRLAHLGHLGRQRFYRVDDAGDLPLFFLGHIGCLLCVVVVTIP